MKSILSSLAFLITLGACMQPNQQPTSEKDGLEHKVDSLLALMSIEEKVGQMTQINLDVVLEGPIYQSVKPHHIQMSQLKEAITKYKVGSILNCGGHAYERAHWLEMMTSIQKMAMESGDHGIPILYGIDAIHGANYTLGSTLFPQQLAQAATFNPDLVKRGSEVTAYEVRASGITWNFSPVLDLGRQPLWSRFFETYGEDVLLAKRMGVAAIEGYQGDLGKEHVAACMKHFVGYSFPFTGKDRTPVYMGERHLREYYLPTFQAAIASGAKTVMVNSGEINGIPVHADRYLLNDVLRDELGFEGLVVTDWEDIMKLYSIHHVTHDNREAVKLAIESGIDMSMVPNDYAFTEDLLDLVKSGEITEARIDASVRRILKLKYELGMFIDGGVPEEDDFPMFGSEDHAEIAYQTALEAITLLKNENSILPLAKDEKIMVVGPAANSLDLINGAWSRTWQGGDTFIIKEKSPSILEAMQANFDAVSYVEGASIDSLHDLRAVLNLAQGIDKVVLCLGEKPGTEKPGDINDLEINEAQIALAEGLLNAGKRVVLVLVQNRPQIISRFVDRCEGVVMAYQPGNEGGKALAALLSGDENFSGRLPFTYPKEVNDFATYDHKATEELDQKFGMMAFDPLFEFGTGLGYSEIAYQALKLDQDSLHLGDTLRLQLQVSNLGNRAAKTSVLVYVQDEVASITPSVKRLRDFSKISLAPNETQTVTFEIPVQSLAFVGHDVSEWVLEDGWFTVMVGQASSRFFLSTSAKK